MRMYSCDGCRATACGSVMRSVTPTFCIILTFLASTPGRQVAAVYSQIYSSSFTVQIVKHPNKGHFERALFGRFKMHWNYREESFGTSSFVLCKEVYCTVSSFGAVHYQRFIVVLVFFHTKPSSSYSETSE